VSADLGAGTERPDEPVEESAEDRAARSWRRRRARLVVKLRRQRVGLLVLAALLVVAALAGWAVGRAMTPQGPTDTRALVEGNLLPLAVDADGIWTSSSDDREPVSEALVRLRRDDDAAMVEQHHERWIAAYDGVLTRLAGLDLPVDGRPIQRQVIAAVTLSRDAVEVLGYAATVDDRAARYDLTTEVGRLRQRSEQLIQSARASTSDLGSDTRVDVSPLPEITPHGEAGTG
jgi:hypothetical protein